MQASMLPPLFFSVRVPTLLARFWRTYLGPKTTSARRRHGPLSFIVFRLDALGDVVLTTPLFRELKRAFPNSHCTAVVQNELRPALATNPYIDVLLSPPELKRTWLPRRARKLVAALLLYWRWLRDRRYDVAISPRWEVDEHLATMLCLLTNAGERVGYGENVSLLKQRLNRGFDAAFSVRLSAGPVRHEVLRNLAVVEALGGKAEDTSLDIRLTQRDRQFAATLLAGVPAGTRLVALGIGARSAGRRWPLDRYAQAVSRLARHFSVQAIVVCAEHEWQEAAQLAGLLEGNPIVLCGAQLRNVCAVLELCDVFLGNDSGSAHLAAAMNCKTIVISRHPCDGDPNHANSPLRFAPYCNENRVLQPASGLQGCTTACCSRQPHCITAVSVEEVVVAAREMLGNSTADLARSSAVSPFLHAIPSIPCTAVPRRAQLPLAPRLMSRKTGCDTRPTA